MQRWIRFLAARRVVVFLLVALALLPVGPIATGANAAGRRALAGHLPKNFNQLTPLGALSAKTRLTLTIALRPRSAGALAQLAATRSARLSVAEVAARFGASDADVQSLTNYLAGYRLQVSTVSPDHLTIQVHGTVADIQRALSVQLENYRDPDGRTVYSPTTDPQLPVSLADSVVSIVGLNDSLVLHPLHEYVPPKLKSEGLGSAPGNYVPADMQSAYDLTSLYNQGLNGNGVTIGIIGCDTFRASDIQEFSINYGLPNPSINVVNVDGGADGTSVESTMDLEWSHAIAPNANLRFYGFAQNCSFQGFLDAVSAASNENIAKVISISLGACESDYAQTSYLTAMENQFQVAAAEGQSILVASGDSGGYCVNGNGTTLVDVSYPAASAYVTAVGGTSLSLNNLGGYGSETAWGYWYPTSNGSVPWGSGGGYSTVIGEPAFQSQAGIPDSSGERALPDVAWNADPQTGSCVYFQSSTQCGWGGTSIAAPQWAGLVAILDQKNAQPVGLLGTVLYGRALRCSTTSLPAYHDVTQGSNLVYNAGSGWDAATGWGSPDASNLLAKLFPTTVSGGPTAYRIYLPFVNVQANVC